MIGHVRSPIEVRRPSAIVLGAVCGISSPAFIERATSSAPSGSAAKIRMFGWSPFAATQHPDSMPPPPTGTMIASSGPPSTCSKNSRINVPCPLITSGWLYGGIKIDPGFSSSSLCANFTRSSTIGGQCTTVAPYSLTASTLTVGALLGMTINAWSPASFAASASAWAWFPLLCVTKGPLPPPSTCLRTALVAPRNLNAPTFWKSSHLKNSSRPAREEMAPQVMTGVRVTAPLIRSAASWTLASDAAYSVAIPGW
mmetsp:Transcript_33823/g.80085  ORF Transcript_33823/g.80085 Transcript_33823/m.80085 type:complete len:255 (-) Transcript_33823:21-785(-)